MKKKRRAKRKVPVNWSEESYVPLMVARDTPKTGNTKFIRPEFPKPVPECSIDPRPSA
ncbi:MAG: hypothetical protein L0Y58_05280 [Verrucomicrobia subdivision 3 bacterium]|nr:hypothetical protein [Limisphaerales bacterium]